MSKYFLLWTKISELFNQNKQNTLILTFEEIEKLGKEKIDHSFLKFKSELETFNYKVEKISLKNKTIKFKKI